MIIRYLDRSALDPDRWDDCVRASSQRLVYAASWYLDALTTGDKAPYWGGIVAEEQGGYVAVMPVVYKKKYGIRYAFQPDYCQQLGVFSRSGVDLQTVFPEFWKLLNRHVKWVVSYRFNEKNEHELSFPAGLPLVKRSNHVLPLDKPYAEIYKGYATDRKSNLNRARNTAWVVEESRDVRPLIQLHRTHNEEKAVGGIDLDLTIYDRFAQAVDGLHQRGLVRIWMARKEGEQMPEAGGVFVMDANRIIYLFNGASVAGRKQQARLWMINRLVEEFAGTPLEFDFESPAVGAESVKAYYRSFGAESRLYTEISYNHLPRFFTYVRAFVRGLRSRLGKKKRAEARCH
ncbi:GNAT family N-acetyltransferase [Larkinella insperata]|uniref:GNAT family N-acetyltransferase n=1 Tax=Larkinella insperata TaxID=332158 RepID=A0ABW3Q9L4_9BACT|nr:GNAT family N-acetyltransferase [Larkinella insperata]